MFTLRVTVEDIPAAHHLPGYPGDCARPHGHNWSFVAVIGAEELHEDMVADFRLIKSVFRALDHTDLNAIPALAPPRSRPTAERLAVYLAEELQRRLDALPNRPRVLQLTVRETPANEVVYRPPSAGA